MEIKEEENGRRAECIDVRSNLTILQLGWCILRSARVKVKKNRMTTVKRGEIALYELSAPSLEWRPRFLRARPAACGLRRGA